MAGRCSGYVDLNLLWKCLCLHLRIFRALQVRRWKVQVWWWSTGTGCVYWASGALRTREEITHAQNPLRMQNWEDLQIPERTERLEKSAGNTKAQFGKCKANPSGGDRGMAAARRGCCELLGATGLGKAFGRCRLKCPSLLGRG